MNWWILSQGWFIESFDVLYSEWSQVTDPYLDLSNGTHSEGLDNVWEGAGTQAIKGRLFNTNQQNMMQKILSWHQCILTKSYWLAIRDLFPLTFIFWSFHIIHPVCLPTIGDKISFLRFYWLQKMKIKLFLPHPLHAMLCCCSSYVQKTTNTPTLNCVGGKGVHSFVFWSYPIWVQCLNNFITDWGFAYK